MAFKMRSGNTPKFKMVGSSPFKQEVVENTDDDGLTGGEEIKSRTKEYKKLRAEADIASEKREARSAEIKHLKENAPWTDKAKNLNKERIGVDDPDTPEDESQELIEGHELGTSTDLDVAKYKSKTAIRHDKKSQQLTREAEDDDATTDEDESKYSRQEKYRDKQTNLLDQYQRARGTGANALSFNLLNAITGGSVGSGFSVGPKKDKIAKKMAKNQTRINKQKAQDASSKSLNKQKNANRTKDLNARIAIAEAEGNLKKVERLTKKLPANKATRKQTKLNTRIDKATLKGKTKKATRLKHKRHVKTTKGRYDAI